MPVADMKIFFVAYEQANVVSIAPVMNALARAGSWDPVFVPGVDFKEYRGSLATAMAPAGITSRTLEDEVDVSNIECARQRGAVVLERVRRWAATVSISREFEGRVAGSGLDALFAREYMTQVFEAYATIESTLEDFARRERPRIAVVQEDTDYMRGRLAARVLSRNGAVVVCLLPWYYNVFLSYPLVGERYATHYCVGNRVYGDRLAAQGVPLDRISVVGNPGFDALATCDARAPATPSFLYALQGGRWEPQIVTDLVSIFDDLRGAQLRIKPHPRLPYPEWLGHINAPANVAIVAREADGVRLMSESTCVIAGTSRMLYEASILGCTVIVPHYSAMPPSLYLPAADRDAVVARTRGGLRRNVELVLAGRGCALTRAEIAPHYPHSTQRVIQCLEELRDRLC